MNTSEVLAVPSCPQDRLTRHILGIKNPGPALSKAWTHLSELDDAFADFVIKKSIQGLTRGERNELKLLGVARHTANVVVDALIDARDGVFNVPSAYAA